MHDDIPAPSVLDETRVSRDDREDMTAEDHRSQAVLFEQALAESCGYARQLWEHLAAAREYLYESLPEHSEPAQVAGARPRGPHDDEGWQRWQDAYAAVTSVLCGPNGDSGLGRSDATVLGQARRRDVTADPRPAGD